MSVLTFDAVEVVPVASPVPVEVGVIPGPPGPGGGGGGGEGTVTSVNGVEPDEDGDITLPIPTTAAEVGADEEGTATAAVDAHVAATDPHGDRAHAAGLVDSLGLGTAATSDADDFAPASHGTHLPTPTIPADELKVVRVKTGGGFELAGAASGGHAIQDEGSARTDRATLNFRGFGIEVRDNPTTGATDVWSPDWAPDPKSSGGAQKHGPMVAGSRTGGTLNRCYFVPFDCQFDDRYLEQFTVEVVAGAASAVVRFGLHYNAGDGTLPRIADLGTESAAAAGLKTLSLPSGSRPEFTHSQTLLSVCVQGRAATLRMGDLIRPTQRSLVSGGSLPQAGAYYQDGVTGTLPAPSFAPFSGTLTTELPHIALSIGDVP